jgi:predicted AAA+ superfamily ATPase
MRTFLEQDIPQLGIQIPANTLRRFWSLLAHYNGQLLNYSEIGRVFGISDTTVKKYIDILAGTFMVDALSPWFANIAKRQVKSSKFYFSDTGVFHSLAKIDSRMDLLAHPRLGSSWETFVLASIRSQFRGEIFFWGTQSDAEIDFIIETKKGLIGIEAKFTDQPKITPSMRIALADLELEFIYVVYPGERSFMLSDKIKVIPLSLLSGALSF